MIFARYACYIKPLWYFVPQGKNSMISTMLRIGVLSKPMVLRAIGHKLNNIRNATHCYIKSQFAIIASNIPNRLLITNLRFANTIFISALWSSGLRHRPFTAVTRVRTSVGSPQRITGNRGYSKSEA